MTSPRETRSSPETLGDERLIVIDCRDGVEPSRHRRRTVRISEYRSLFPDRMPVFSTLLRRQGDSPWETLSNGLPPDDGTAKGTHAAGGPGVFYYMTDDADLYRSQDGGSSFTKIEYDAVDTGSAARALAVLPA